MDINNAHFIDRLNAVHQKHTNNPDNLDAQLQKDKQCEDKEINCPNKQNEVGSLRM